MFISVIDSLKSSLTFSYLIGILCLYSSLSHAQEIPFETSFTFHHQGTLHNASNTPLNGLYIFTFRLYTSADAFNPFWEEIHEGVDVRQGYFSSELGCQVVLPVSEMRALPLYLGL